MTRTVTQKLSLVRVLCCVAMQPRLFDHDEYMYNATLLIFFIMCIEKMKNVCYLCIYIHITSINYRID